MTSQAIEKALTLETNEQNATTRSMGQIAIILAFFMMLCSPAAAQDFDKGMAAYEVGDYATALKEWRSLAEAGNVFAQFDLGLMYDIGQGVPQDNKEAVKWYELAADQGYPDAQVALGSTYAKGRGVLQNYIRAHMWFNISAANGNEGGAKNRDNIAKKMTPADISKAQDMARECMSSNYTKCGY
jgi:TPR repeat protein